MDDVISEIKQALSLRSDETDLAIGYKEHLNQGCSEKSCEIVA